MKNTNASPSLMRNPNRMVLQKPKQEIKLRLLSRIVILAKVHGEGGGGGGGGGSHRIKRVYKDLNGSYKNKISGECLTVEYELSSEELALLRQHKDRPMSARDARTRGKALARKIRCEVAKHLVDVDVLGSVWLLPSGKGASDARGTVVVIPWPEEASRECFVSDHWAATKQESELIVTKVTRGVEPSWGGGTLGRETSGCASFSRSRDYPFAGVEPCWFPSLSGDWLESASLAVASLKNMRLLSRNVQVREVLERDRLGGGKRSFVTCDGRLMGVRLFDAKNRGSALPPRELFREIVKAAVMLKVGYGDEKAFERQWIELKQRTPSHLDFVRDKWCPITNENKPFEDRLGDPPAGSWNTVEVRGLHWNCFPSPHVRGTLELFEARRHEAALQEHELLRLAADETKMHRGWDVVMGGLQRYPPSRVEEILLPGSVGGASRGEGERRRFARDFAAGLGVAGKGLAWCEAFLLFESLLLNKVYDTFLLDQILGAQLEFLGLSPLSNGKNEPYRASFEASRVVTGGLSAGLLLESRTVASSNNNNNNNNNNNAFKPKEGSVFWSQNTSLRGLVTPRVEKSAFATAMTVSLENNWWNEVYGYHLERLRLRYVELSNTTINNVFSNAVSRDEVAKKVDQGKGENKFDVPVGVFEDLVDSWNDLYLLCCDDKANTNNGEEENASFLFEPTSSPSPYSSSSSPKPMSPSESAGGRLRGTTEEERFSSGAGYTTSVFQQQQQQQQQQQVPAPPLVAYGKMTKSVSSNDRSYHQEFYSPGGGKITFGTLYGKVPKRKNDANNTDVREEPQPKRPHQEAQRRPDPRAADVAQRSAKAHAVLIARADDLVSRLELMQKEFGGPMNNNRTSANLWQGYKLKLLLEMLERVIGGSEERCKNGEVIEALKLSVRYTVRKFLFESHEREARMLATEEFRNYRERGANRDLPLVHLSGANEYVVSSRLDLLPPVADYPRCSSSSRLSSPLRYYRISRDPGMSEMGVEVDAILANFVLCSEQELGDEFALLLDRLYSMICPEDPKEDLPAALRGNRAEVDFSNRQEFKEFPLYCYLSQQCVLKRRTSSSSSGDPLQQTSSSSSSSSSFSSYNGAANLKSEELEEKFFEMIQSWTLKLVYEDEKRGYCDVRDNVNLVYYTKIVKNLNAFIDLAGSYAQGTYFLLSVLNALLNVKLFVDMFKGFERSQNILECTDDSVINNLCFVFGCQMCRIYEALQSPELNRENWTELLETTKEIVKEASGDALDIFTLSLVTRLGSHYKKAREMFFTPKQITKVSINICDNCYNPYRDCEQCDCVGKPEGSVLLSHRYSKREAVDVGKRLISMDIVQTL